MGARRTARTRSRNRRVAGNPIKFTKRKPRGLKKKEKTSNKKRRGNGSVNDISNMITCSDLLSGNNVNVDDNIVYEILSRLPVKSLMRFKCVSKQWCSMIQTRNFIDLHLNRSKARPRLFIALSCTKNIDNTRIENKRSCSRGSGSTITTSRKLVLVTAELLFEGGDLSAAVDNTREMDTLPVDTVSVSYRVSKNVNGLICLYNPQKNHRVRVCNIITREVTPWIQPSFLERQGGNWGSMRRPRCDLGFDPVTKEHKLICIWYVNERHIFEVLTVGDFKWRTIDNVLPAYDFRSWFFGASVYVNGSIYYSPDTLKYPTLLAAFDVGMEKFRTIGIPDSILGQIPEDKYPPTGSVQLLEIDGHPALLCRISCNVAKIWSFDDDYNHGCRSNTWKEVSTIELPFYWGDDGKRTDGYYHVRFHSVIGTDVIIVYLYMSRTKHRSPKVRQHSYNWKNKTFTTIKIDGIPPSIPYLENVSIVSTFVESLLPVL